MTDTYHGLLMEAVMLACGATEDEIPLVHAALHDVPVALTREGIVADIRAALEGVRDS